MIKPKKNPVTKIAGKIVKEVLKKNSKSIAKKEIKKAIPGRVTSKKVAARVASNKADRVEFMFKNNPGDTPEDAAIWATHPGAASFKSNQRLVKKNKWSSEKQIARYQKQEAKSELKGEKRGLKAANKPTKASKTFVGSNKNLSPSVRRDIIVNQTKPARPNRERGGSLKTLRKQGKTGKSK